VRSNPAMAWSIDFSLKNDFSNLELDNVVVVVVVA
jgi:hypothetical protein